MNWELVDCTRGDMIRVNLGGLYHYGIYVSDEEVIQFGYPPVLRNKDKNNVVVVVTDITTFSCGKIVEVASLTKGDRKKKFKPETIVDNARKRIGEGGYNIIHNNCEHFAYECYCGVHYSSQEDEARKKWNQIGFINVYFFDIPVDEHSSEPMVSFKQELESLTNNKNKKEGTSYLLSVLKSALQHSLSKRFEDINFKVKNDYVLINDCFISISEARDFGCIVTSNHNIGSCLIDHKDMINHLQFVEVEKLMNEILAKNEATKTDVNKYVELLVKKNSIRDFLKKKSLPYKKINIAKYPLTFFVVKGKYDLSICGDNPETIRFFLVDDKGVSVFKGKIEE